MRRLNILIWLGTASLVFVAGLLTGIHLASAKLREPIATTPLQVDFCSLAQNQEFFAGTQVVTTARLISNLEGAVLGSDSCPERSLPFRVLSDDACWKKISDDYYASPLNTEDFLVTLKAFVNGPPRSVSWFRRSNKQTEHPARGPALVTLNVERITNCTKN
jgi:hypothetical protein